jgi:hypothetical protein
VDFCNEPVPKLIYQLKLNKIKKWDVYIRKTGMSFRQIYKPKRFFKKIEYKEKKNK